MTLFWVLDLLCLLGLVAGSALVVWLRNLAGAVMALSFVGVTMTLLFLLLGAPDDAHAEAVVGAIALPTLYLVALGKVRTVVRDSGDLGEPAEQPGADDDDET